MASKLEQIKNQISDLGSDEITILMNDLKSIEKEARKRERAAKAEEYKKSLKLDDKVRYISGGKKIVGRVVQIGFGKIQLAVEGGQRKRNIGWEDIEEVIPE